MISSKINITDIKNGNDKNESEYKMTDQVERKLIKIHGLKYLKHIFQGTKHKRQYDI